MDQFKKEGFLPEAMINYLALLGWNDGSEQEVFSVSGYVAGCCGVEGTQAAAWTCR